MAVKVAINGFGRIGRLAFRQMFGHEGSNTIHHRVSMHLLIRLQQEKTASLQMARQSRYTKRRTQTTFLGKSSEQTLYSSAQVSTQAKRSHRHTSMPVLRKQLFQLLQETIFLLSYIMLTTRALRLMMTSFQLLLVQQTALHLWQRHLTTSFLSRAVSCQLSTLTQVTR